MKVQRNIRIYPTTVSTKQTKRVVPQYDTCRCVNTYILNPVYVESTLLNHTAFTSVFDKFKCIIHEFSLTPLALLYIVDSTATVGNWATRRAKLCSQKKICQSFLLPIPHGPTWNRTQGWRITVQVIIQLTTFTTILT